jgi:hypothetical protein
MESRFDKGLVRERGITSPPGGDRSIPLQSPKLRKLHTNSMKPDPRCPYHPDAGTIVLPSGNMHGAKLCCEVCTRYLKWIPKDDDRLTNLVFLKPKEGGKQMTLFE